MFIFPYEFLRALDGDTVEVLVDCGFRIYAKLLIRLHGINCPEMPTVEGSRAKEFAEAWLRSPDSKGTTLTGVKPEKRPAPDKYGRWLGVFNRPDSTTLNEALVSAGLAERYFGDDYEELDAFKYLGTDETIERAKRLRNK